MVPGSVGDVDIHHTLPLLASVQTSSDRGTRQVLTDPAT